MKKPSPPFLYYLKYYDNINIYDYNESDEKLKENVKFIKILVDNKYDSILPRFKRSVSKSKLFRQSLKHGNYNLLLYSDLNQINQETYKECVYGLYERKSKTPKLLFKHCKNNREKQFKFLEEISKNQIKIHPITMICMLIELQDIELIEFYLKSVESIDKWLKEVNPTPTISIAHSIETIEMLDYCFNKFNNHFNRISISCWYEYGRINLIKRYTDLRIQSNCVNDSIKNILLPFDSEFLLHNRKTSFNGKLLQTMCWFIKIQNLQLFSGNGDGSPLSNENAVNECIALCRDKNLYLNELIFILSKTKTILDGNKIIKKKKYSDNIITTLKTNIGHNSSGELSKFSEFVNWAYYSQSPSYIDLNKFKIQPIDLYYQTSEFNKLMDYIENEFKEYTNERFFSSKICKQLLFEIGRLGNISGFRNLFNYLPQSIDAIKEVLTISAQYGRINIFQQLNEILNQDPEITENYLGIDTHFKHFLINVTTTNRNFYLLYYFNNHFSIIYK